MIIDYSENKTLIAYGFIGVGVFLVFGGSGGDGEKVGCGSSATSGTGGGAGVENCCLCRLGRCIALTKEVVKS